jgi:adenine deaminase
MKHNRAMHDHPSRRDFIAMTLLAGAAPARTRGLHAHALQDVVSESRELGLVNGRIYTFDAANRVVNSVLIRDGRIAAVGQGAQGARRVIDLQGRTVVPGLIDNHTHFVRIGNLPGHSAA